MHPSLKGTCVVCVCDHGGLSTQDLRQERFRISEMRRWGCGFPQLNLLCNFSQQALRLPWDLGASSLHPVVQKDSAGRGTLGLWKVPGGDLAWAESRAELK